MVRADKSLFLTVLAVAGLVGCGDDGTPTTGLTGEPTTGMSSGVVTTTGTPTTGATTGAPTTTEGTGSATGTTGGTTEATTGSTGPATTDVSTTTGSTTDVSSSSSGGAGVCGDGMVDAGEQCDDGNGNDGDACTNMCTLAVCGDGIVGPGEACDDGNQNDADDCTNACALASCGDAVVQPGEDCDDGNMVDTDACLATCKTASCGDMVVQAGVEECDDANADDTDACVTGCKNAKCGDGFVQAGVEACDDGNVDETDMCTFKCAAPTCMDMAKNGPETDVDCGGMCMKKCGLGLSCVGGVDCGTGFCSMNKCSVAASCKEIKANNPTAVNGVYPLDPDGPGPIAQFNAFCEMTIDGGGWTLALKADGRETTFLYDAAIWTVNNTYNTGASDLDRTEAKLQSYNTIAFTEVLIGMEYPILNMGPLNLKTVKLPAAKPSLLNLFQGGYVATNIGRNAWKGLITGGSLQPNCNREGFNSAPAGNAWPRSRIGIVSNQENDCASPDSYLGIGNQQAGCGQPETRVGNMASCTPDNGDKSLAAFGAVFVR